MTDPIMDAGAWRREALGLRGRVRELEAALLEERYACAAALDAANDRTAHARFIAAGWRRLAATLRGHLADADLIGEGYFQAAMSAQADCDSAEAERDRMRAVVEAACPLAAQARKGVDPLRRLAERLTVALDALDGGDDG